MAFLNSDIVQMTQFHYNKPRIENSLKAITTILINAIVPFEDSNVHCFLLKSCLWTDNYLIIFNVHAPSIQTSHASIIPRSVALTEIAVLEITPKLLSAFRLDNTQGPHIRRGGFPWITLNEKDRRLKVDLSRMYRENFTVGLAA